MALETVLDILLIGTLLWVAWRALSTPALFKGIVLFIAFGLLISLAWVRLNAADIALAEAAIGSGLTGALLLSALGRMRRMERSWREEQARTGASIPSPIFQVHQNPAGGQDPRHRLKQWPLRILTLALAFGLSWAVLALPSPAAGLSGVVAQALAESGVENPVTAVLLNFRGYDTLLEVAVLLLAVVGVWAFARFETGIFYNPTSPVLMALVRLLLPIMLVVAGYLVWIGAEAPGGAFQAGAVLGGAGVLWLLSEARQSGWRRDWLLRAGVSLGLLFFVGVAGGVMVGGRPLLSYPPEQAKNLIILVEVAATISIALILASLFLGCRPGSLGDPLPTQEESQEEG